MQKRSRNSHTSLPEQAIPSQILGKGHVLKALGPVVYATRTPLLERSIKIGYTENLAHRLSALGGYGGLLAIKTDATRADEKRIHQLLTGRAIYGREWYADDDPAVIKVINELRAGLGLSALDVPSPSA